MQKKIVIKADEVLFSIGYTVLVNLLENAEVPQIKKIIEDFMVNTEPKDDPLEAYTTKTKKLPSTEYLLEVLAPYIDKLSLHDIGLTELGKNVHNVLQNADFHEVIFAYNSYLERELIKLLNIGDTYIQHIDTVNSCHILFTDDIELIKRLANNGRTAVNIPSHQLSFLIDEPIIDDLDKAKLLRILITYNFKQHTNKDGSLKN